MSTLLPYLLVGAGGFAGTIARYVVARSVGNLFETRFPLATFVINISGSFLLGLLWSIVAPKATPNAEVMLLALGAGFLGAFTTFSTFALEADALLTHGNWLAAITYMFGSLLLGLIAVRAGIMAGSAWVS